MNGVDTDHGDDAAGRSRGAGYTVAEARAAAEAERAERRAERERQLGEIFGDGIPGRAVIAASWVATAVLSGVSVLTLVDRDTVAVYFVVTFSLFCLGGLLMVLDVVLAAARSTRDLMGIGGLFFLVDAAPRSVRRSLNASLASAVVVSVLTAVFGLSTPELAFGTLVPLLQLSLSGLWGVAYGAFTQRKDLHGDG